MLDIGWSELLVIGVVALIVVGPKDLPVMFRRLGEFTGKAKAMAREFTSAMNAAADEAGVKDIGKDLRKMANPKQTGLDAINRAAEDLSNWDDADKRSARADKASKTPKPASAGMTPEREEAARKIREQSAAKAAEQSAAAAAPAAPAPDAAAAAPAGTDDRTP
jgi:sec-independent protein translocase protein TatB